MNKIELKNKAEKLLTLLSHYSKFDKEAVGLLHGLTPFINEALAASVDASLDWTDMPGGSLFNEGSLGQYADLETAYAEFKIEITCVETSALRKLREQERRRKESGRI